MTENKKAKLENSIAKVDKSKPDKKEYSNKSSSSQGVSDPYKAIIKNAIIPIFFILTSDGEKSYSSII